MKLKKKKIKNTDEGIISQNGIKIDGDIKFAYNKELNKAHYKAVQVLTAFIASACTMRMAVSFVTPDVEFNVVLFFIIMLTAALAALSSKEKLLKTIGLMYMTLHCILLVPMFNKIATGFYVVLNRYLFRAGQTDSITASFLLDVSYDDYDHYASVFWVLIATIVVAVVMVACVYKIDFPLLFIITFPFLEMGLYWGWEPPTLSAVGLIVCWIIVLAVHILNHTTNKAGKGNTFAVHKRKNLFYLTSDNIKKKFFTIYSTGVAIICLAAFAAMIIFSSISGFVRPEKFTELRRNISMSVDEFSFNSWKNIFDDYEGGLDIFKVKAVGGTNGGVLGEAGEISFNGSTALKVKTERPEYTLYLRGYVAGKYEDNKWSQIDISDTDALKVFEENDYCVQDYDYIMNKRFNQLIGIGDEEKGHNSIDKDITVSVIGASKKFVYAPYMTLYTSDKNKGDDKLRPTDESFVSLRKKKYTLTYANLDNLGTDWSYISQALVNRNYDDYSDIYSRRYNNFVKKYYTDTYSSDALDKAYDEINKGLYVYDLPSVQQAIASYFNTNFKYTLSPGVTPDGEDFIDYFLTEQHEGYCSYFASAGVMLMRKFGFPARYVEGYTVLPTQFSDTEDVSEATVTDKAAHAWCEVYVDNVGWLPCEFTPGYDGDNPNMTATEKDPTAIVTTKPTTTTTTTTTAVNSKPDSSSNAQVMTSATTSSSDSSAAVLDSSAASNDSTAANGGIGNGSGESRSSGIGRILLMYVAGIAAIIAVVVIRRLYKLSIMEKKIKDNDTNTAAKNIYYYYIKYLALLSVLSSANASDIQTAEALIKICKDKNIADIDENIRAVTELAVEAQLSRNKITDEQVKAARKMLYELAENVVLPCLSAVGRFAAKWIYNLY